MMGKYPGIKLKFQHGNAEEFGESYTGSAKAKQNRRKAMILAKQNR